MKAAIFGSCVSRDLFEDTHLRPLIRSYLGRCSVISAVAPPLPIHSDRVVLSSDWQRRCVLADFRKTFFSTLSEERPEWLVIDMIDERFNLLRTADSIVTRSSAFEAANLSSATEFSFEPVRRMSNLGCALFDDASVQFASRVMKTMPAERVIIHRAFWATCYRESSEPQPTVFDAEKVQLCHLQNDMLTKAYDALEAAFGGRAMSIETASDTHVADAGHRWGLEPYHYGQDYNDDARRQLRSAMKL